MAVKTTQTQAQTQTATQTAASFTGFGLRSTISAFAGGGAYFDALYNKMNEKVEQINKEANTSYRLVKVVKTIFGINYSSIAMAFKDGNRVYTHALMVEKTGEYPTPIYENIGNTKVEITRVPGDAVDQRYSQAVTKAVADSYGVGENDVIFVDATLIPNELDIEDVESVEYILANAIDAVTAEAYIDAKNYRGINIAEIMRSLGNKGQFVVNLYYSPTGTNIMDGPNPVRADVCITLSYRSQNTYDKSINKESSYEIVSTYGYFDFQFMASADPMNPMSKQRFVPNFVITKIKPYSAPTPDILLLAVASVVSLRDDISWIQTFKSSPVKKGEIDYNDIGALNIEGNIENNPSGYGKKIDTKSAEFNLNSLYTLINQLVRPNTMMVSLDVGQASSDTWFESALAYALTDTKANARIVEFANNLTNGVANMHPSTSVVFGLVNKFHGGFYKTKEGVKDLRNLSSYLSVANYIADTNQNPQLISEYTNTLYSNVPDYIRAAERKKFIDNMSGGTAIYKQYYTRITFDANFIDLLVKSLHSVGFVPVLGNMAGGAEFFTRSSYDLRGAMLDQNVRLVATSTPYSGSGYYGGYYRQF